MKKVYVNILVVLAVVVVMSMSHCFGNARAEATDTSKLVPIESIDSKEYGRVPILDCEDEYEVFKVDDAMSYVEHAIREQGILHAHLYWRVVVDENTRLQAYIPEFDSVFMTKVMEDSYSAYKYELDAMVEEIVVFWQQKPLSLIDATDYVYERLCGTDVEDVFGCVSKEGDEIYFTFCIFRNGEIELRFVSAYFDETIAEQYVISYMDLDGFCDGYLKYLSENEI